MRDYRKANGLCYYCGDKFEPNHAQVSSKRPRAQVNALAINCLDTELTDELLEQLDVEDSLATEFCQLSLNVVLGTEEGEALKLRALVNNKVMLILVDSGSSHSFISKSFMHNLGIQGISIEPKQVKVANGETLITDQKVPQLSWWINGRTLQTDMRVLELGAYNAILGFDWLKSHSPMNFHWEERTLEFLQKGQAIKLQGILPTPKQILPVLVEKGCSGLRGMIFGQWL